MKVKDLIVGLKRMDGEADVQVRGLHGSETKELVITQEEVELECSECGREYTKRTVYLNTDLYTG